MLKCKNAKSWKKQKKEPQCQWWFWTTTLLYPSFTIYQWSSWTSCSYFLNRERGEERRRDKRWKTNITITITIITSTSSICFVLSWNEVERERTSCTLMLWRWKPFSPIELTSSFFSHTTKSRFRLSSSHHSHKRSNKATLMYGPKSDSHFVMFWFLSLKLKCVDVDGDC